METLRLVLSWALCGLVVGVIARLLVPGRHALGILRTILLGILGAFLGGLIYWVIYRTPGDPFSFQGNAWHGWLLSILGAVILLAVFTWWQRGAVRRRWW
jgi:uncharacterized membrane protein YeaQ/YmgE (transglycosylase-associated protein family)